ncbi:41177_t:CDS:2, partial [Gigaspora margarita]
VWKKISSRKGERLTATHWIRTNKTLKKCDACDKNDVLLKRKKCTLSLNTSDIYIVQVDSKYKIHIRTEDIDEYDWVVSNNTKNLSMANPDPYYDNIDTATVDSSESESQNRYNIKSQTIAKSHR